MVLNDSFSMMFRSPASLKKANDSFNESFGDKNTLSPCTIFRILQKEHDQISSCLRFHPPTSSQFQNSLIELITLYERAEDLSTFGFQKLILSVFLKLCANVLTGLGKPKSQPTLFKMSQMLANSVIPDLGPDNEIEEKNLQKWADRVVIETTIQLLDFPNFQLDLELNIGSIIEDLGFASGRFQFVKSSIFETARFIVAEIQHMPESTPDSKFTTENIGDEHFLQLVLWYFLRHKNVLNGDLLQSLFPTLPLTPNAVEIVKSPISLLDVKLYLISLSVLASSTTDAGMTAKSSPLLPSHLVLTKHQKDCWKAVVDASAGVCSKPATALSRLRTSQLVDSVRLTSDGSEDVRVLFEAWKACLQLSAAQEEHVFEAVKVLTERYRNKMNSILAYGPFYSSEASSFEKQSSCTRRDMKTLFPLQFDYEFVDTTEAGHIGVVINSLEGFNPSSSEPAVNKAEDQDGQEEKEEEGFDEDSFHSFATASDRLSSADNSQFFSPLKRNRQSMLPSTVSQLIRDEANTSHVSTKSVILTPTRGRQSPSSFVARVENLADALSQAEAQSTPPKASGQTFNIFEPKTPQKVEEEAEEEEDEDEDVEEEEEDELEVALLESAQKHEQSILTQKTPEKIVPVVTPMKTPTRDAQTETDIVEISPVVVTPLKKEVSFTEHEDEEESEVEDEDVLNESQLEFLNGQLLEATSRELADRQMHKFGLVTKKIPTVNASDEEIMRIAEEKLKKMTIDLNKTLERLEAIKASATTGNFKSLQLAQEKDHDPAKCFSCQTDEIQERALRKLEQMAHAWDAEGNDYLYQLKAETAKFIRL